MLPTSCEYQFHYRLLNTATILVKSYGRLSSPLDIIAILSTALPPPPPPSFRPLPPLPLHPSPSSVLCITVKINPPFKSLSVSLCDYSVFFCFFFAVGVFSMMAVRGSTIQPSRTSLASSMSASANRGGQHQFRDCLATYMANRNKRKK